MSHRKQGETVSLGLVASPLTNGIAALGIFDANGNARALLSTERLLVDTLEGTTSAGTVDVTAGSTAVASSTLIASFNTAIGLDLESGEGQSLPVGALPYAQSSTSTAVVKLGGVGRIINGTTQGVRPSFIQREF